MLVKTSAVMYYNVYIVIVYHFPLFTIYLLTISIVYHLPNKKSKRKLKGIFHCPFTILLIASLICVFFELPSCYKFI